MSLSKEQLIDISNLKLFGLIDKMDSRGIDDYCGELFSFTESFPVQEIELKRLFSEKEYDLFDSLLSGVKKMLEGLHAVGLALSAQRLMDELKTQKYQIVEAHLAYFLAEVSELSIAIQMARQKNELGSQAGTEEPVATKMEVTGAVSGEKNILAVDDVSLILNSLKLALKNTSYKLTGVKSGYEALQFVKSHSPDLFILDIEMPGMDGYELAKYLRQCGQNAPIIFLTGNAKEEYVRKAIEAGGVGFIVKPVNNEHVLEIIRKYIG